MTRHALISFRVALAAALTTTTLLGGCAQQAVEPNTAADVETGVLLNLTTGQDDLHSVSMGLNLAKTAAERGLPVVVFLNVAAPVFASTALPPDTRYEDFPPVQELLAAIMAGGGKILVCGHCAEVSGVDLSTLLPGIQVSEHGALLDELNSGMVGFSY
jgi:predicted peroxiredoxin